MQKYGFVNMNAPSMCYNSANLNTRFFSKIAHFLAKQFTPFKNLHQTPYKSTKNKKISIETKAQLLVKAYMQMSYWRRIYSYISFSIANTTSLDKLPICESKHGMFLIRNTHEVHTKYLKIMRKTCLFRLVLISLLLAFDFALLGVEDPDVPAPSSFPFTWALGLFFPRPELLVDILSFEGFAIPSIQNWIM